jgi:hypothetical protein
MTLAMLFSYLLNIVTDVVISINFKPFVIEWQNILSDNEKIILNETNNHKNEVQFVN